MSAYGSFYFDGFASVDLPSNETNTKLVSVLNGLMKSDNLREPFTWEQKYQNTVDIRPNVYDYDDVFVSFIKDNELLDKVRRLAQRDLVPYHVQVRKSNPGPSYMDWHRDTYINPEGKVIGMSPGGIKIIFYPTCERNSESRLDLMKGTHICHVKSSVSDAGLLQSGIFDKVTITSNDNKCLIFDVASLHRVVPDVTKSSIRLIYSFVTRDQFNDMKLVNTIHNEFLERFDA